MKALLRDILISVAFALPLYYLLSLPLGPQWGAAAAVLVATVLRIIVVRLVPLAKRTPAHPQQQP